MSPLCCRAGNSMILHILHEVYQLFGPQYKRGKRTERRRCNGGSPRSLGARPRGEAEHRPDSFRPDRELVSCGAVAQPFSIERPARASVAKPISSGKGRTRAGCTHALLCASTLRHTSHEWQGRIDSFDERHITARHGGAQTFHFVTHAPRLWEDASTRTGYT